MADGVSIREVVGKKLGTKGSAGNPSSISEVERKMRDINVVDETIESAKKLAGVDALQQEVQKAREERERIMAENAGLRDQLTAAQIQTLKEGMKSELEMLRQQINAGDRKGVLETLQEFQQAQQLLGLGGAPRSNGLEELKAAYELLQMFQKPLSEQLKEVHEVGQQLRSYAPPPVAGPDPQIESARLQFEIQRSQQQFELQMQMLKIEQEVKNREFELRLEEMRESRKLAKEEANAKVAAERERNAMLSNGIELLGGAIARGIQEFSGQRQEMSFEQPASAPPVQARATSAGPKIGRKLQAEIGEEGPVNCPSCNSEMFLAGDATTVSCPGCGTQYPVERIGNPSGDLV